MLTANHEHFATVTGPGCAVVEDEDITGFHASGLCNLGVKVQMTSLAVYGDQIARSHRIQHHAHFIAAAMPGDMHLGQLAVDHIGSPLEELVEHPSDFFFIVGDRTAGNDDGVATFDLDLTVFTLCHPNSVPSAARLAIPLTGSGAAGQECGHRC